MNGVAYLRVLNNLSLQELANKLGVSNQMVSMWEKGTRLVTLSRAQQLSVTFGLSEEFFLKKELSEIDKLDMQTQALLKNVEGVIEVERIEDDPSNPDGQPLIVPKDFSTDPRFIKIYRNCVRGSFLVALENMKTAFEYLECVNSLVDTIDGVQQNAIINEYYETVNTVQALLWNTIYGVDENDKLEFDVDVDKACEKLRSFVKLMSPTE